ncbi:MAG: 16S rRNA (cytosine(1402)-N(4))-methyltransferase RsmH, partial [Lentisphaeria bacterium]|nr:16S rRNA (cytosine(1402)-N(4))-methyltransferase RsmH [Lentisphaeria bacterium]
MTSPEFSHSSVLTDEVLGAFEGLGMRRLIDGTLGRAGHAARLLGAFPELELLGIDRDGSSLQVASSTLEEQGFGSRAKLYRGSYSEMDAFAAQVGWGEVDGILLDIGVSSPQIDDPARGFSYRQDGPLDMRMDTRAPISAASLLNTESEESLKRIFRKYGEERKAGAVARAVVQRRESKPWERTGEFAELLGDVAWRRRGGPPGAACCFQALRIAVNDELGELERGLKIAVSLLRPG